MCHLAGNAVRVCDQWATSVGAQSLVLLSGPTNEIFVDLSTRLDQPGRIEAPIIIDPSSHYRIDKSCEFLKLHITVEMKTPSFDLVAYLLGGGVADRRCEADEELTPAILG